VAEAIRRGRALEGEGVAWLEEPIRHDDYTGNATVARALAVPVQIGENFNGPEAMIEALAARACDYVMPDAARIGGVSGWIQAAGIAAAHGIEMSSHLLPEISAHLLAASPTCHYLEYVDWADAILEEPLQIQDGLARVPDRPGNRTHVEIGSREGPVAGPLISHLASAVPRCPSRLRERPDLLHAVAPRVARRGVAREVVERHPLVRRIHQDNRESRQLCF